jgi:hypothetical protein
MNYIKYIDKQIRRIPDFENTFPGKRNTMKGLTALTLGTALGLAIPSVEVIASSAGLFLGYSSVGIVQKIKSEIRDYN